MSFRKISSFLCLVAVSALAVSAAGIGDYSATMKPGKADLKSAGVMAFGPDGILFVGDSAGAAIYALDTGDRTPMSKAAKHNISALNVKIAGMLGSTPDQILINDLQVNPISKKAYVSVSRGRGPDAIPVILHISGDGKMDELSLDDINHSSAALSNAPGAEDKDRRGRPLRVQAITDLAYVDGRVFVAGLSNEEFASKLRSIPFPFEEVDNGASVEIFHGAHGRWETRSPVRTFVPYEIQAESHLLAAYTCTPLVKFPISDLKPGTKVVGTTIAELGNRNRPLDMVIYKKGGVDHILMSNSSRGVMKMSTKNIETFGGITDKIGDTAGLPYETIAELKGVQQLDLLDEKNAVLIVQSDSGSLDLKTIAVP
jgi:hypothetical protein